MADIGRRFRHWGVAGLVASYAVAGAVTAALGLRALVEIAIVLAAMATFLALAWASRGCSGRESLIYYHHEIAVLAVAAALAGALGAPVLAHLDATALGLGAFLAFGRIGCLRVGCCHGRPARRGICYGEAHVRAGFPRYLRDVALVPVQALESAAVAVLVAVGALAVLDRHHPGLAFSFYVAGYAVLRFSLEELRGDPVRRYWRGLSEAQWTSLVLTGSELVGERVGLLPSRGVGVVAAAAMAVAVAIVAVRRRHRASPLEARSVRELQQVARTLAARRPAPGPIPVWVTSSGLRVSADRLGTVRHFTLSREEEPLSAPDVERLAEAVGAACAAAPLDVVAGVASTFHVLVPVRSGRGGL